VALCAHRGDKIDAIATWRTIYPGRVQSNFDLQFTPKYGRDVFWDDEAMAICGRSFRMCARSCA